MIKTPSDMEIGRVENNIFQRRENFRDLQSEERDIKKHREGIVPNCSISICCIIKKYYFLVALVRSS